MNAPPVGIIYTQDLDLARRIKAYLRSMAEVRQVTEADRLAAVLQQATPALLFVDLRARESRDLLDQVQLEWPEVLITALGVPRSEPMRDAEQSGIYAAEDLQIDRRRFQSFVARAFDHMRVLQENRDLREDSGAVVPMREPLRRVDSIPERAAAPSLPHLRLPRVFRRFANVEALLGAIVESVADAAGVTRIGVFSKIRAGDRYRLRAGLRCLPETHEMEYGERDPLVRWFERNAHLVSRSMLAETAERSERTILRRALDGFGAEVIVPLYGQGQILGWIFFGHRVTGQRFDYGGLEQLMALADHVSTVLENALLHEETTLQKTLAETLLRSIPPGIIAVDEHGTIRWFNPMAEELLGMSAAKTLHKPIEAVGPMIADFLRDTLETQRPLAPRAWAHPKTKRPLSLETRRLLDGEAALGAVAVIHDLTAEHSLRQKQDVVDRAAFWADLASSMSHEIRNPLVAIKTFAQLLPERFDDADFRKEFNQIVVQEIDRLDRIIVQINEFAHPPELHFRPVDVRASVEKAVEIARSRFGLNGGVALETSLPNDLPVVLGDEKALAEAFAHLLANAAEAVSNQAKPRITLTAKPVREGAREAGVVVTVRDNGKGIAPEMKDKIFSPFATTKARGMGLGLPIVKRTIFDHKGQVEVDSSPQGTEVSVRLPAEANGS
jgi:nitrogen-specific signal transduction histidine kinase/GAF domain-containing protein